MLRKKGVVTSIYRSTNDIEKLCVTIDNSEIEKSCSIKQYENTFCASLGCASCKGCNFSSVDKKGGLLIVQGDKVTAINKTGKKIKEGDKVVVEINEKQATVQAFFSLALPIFFAIIGAFIGTGGKEVFIVLGSFLGFSLGICAAFLVKKILGEKAYPKAVL